MRYTALYNLRVTSNFSDAMHVVVTFFFFNDAATTEIYTLSLHDALPISESSRSWASTRGGNKPSKSRMAVASSGTSGDRKSTRLNSSHMSISYAVFCLKKKMLLDRIVTRSLIERDDAVLPRLAPRMERTQ